MRIKIVLCLSYYMMFCNQYCPIHGLMGENVRDAKKNEFPYIVSLMKVDDSNPNDIEKHMCTGSLISRQDVALSQHCLVDEDIREVHVHVGSRDLRKGKKHEVFWWITYSHWILRGRRRAPYATNDIANIRLFKKVDRSIRPVKISKLENEMLYSKTAIMAGWGWFNDTRNPKLRAVDVKVLSNYECVERISELAEEYLPINPRHVLCTAAEPFALLTNGDSGGPLLYKNELIGISKGGCPIIIGEYHPKLVNLHMSLEFYKTFFMDVIDLEEL